MRFLLLAVYVLIGSTHAAKKSLTEIVSFINDDKQFSCNGRNIEWYFPNNSRIEHSSDKFEIENLSYDESVLTVKKINAMSIGPYKCLSIVDGVEEDFDLKLFYPLTINYFNRLQTVKENDNATLKCKTISIPKVRKITWYHNDQELVPDVDYTEVSDGIFLENVKPENAGEYSCVAVQELGSLKNIQQRDMQLIVEYGPRQLDTVTTDVYIKIGETHQLTCEAQSEPSPIFTWLINGYETFEHISSHAYTSNLQVHVDSADDLQTYTCLASNIHGQSNQTFVLKEKVELLVEDSPSKTTSKTAGVILYTLALIFSTFIIY
ncbi:neural cell adhesion molecule 1-B-like [Chironomus tepperi]|uniref:neural cell adhesion molecule 1-B-like n=1 Tax=Chironomus tepperi TaxID=113505 RepID=UPI00391EFAB3